MGILKKAQKDHGWAPKSKSSPCPEGEQEKRMEKKRKKIYLKKYPKVRSAVSRWEEAGRTVAGPAKGGGGQDTLVSRALHSCFPFCLHFLRGFLNDFVHAASCLHWLACGDMCHWKARRTDLWRTAPVIHLDAHGHQHLSLSSPSAMASVPCFSLKKKKIKRKRKRK